MEKYTVEWHYHSVLHSGKGRLSRPSTSEVLKLVLHKIIVMYESEVFVQLHSHIRSRNLYGSAAIFSRLFNDAREQLLSNPLSPVIGVRKHTG